MGKQWSLWFRTLNKWMVFQLLTSWNHKFTIHSGRSRKKMQWLLLYDGWWFQQMSGGTERDSFLAQIQLFCLSLKKKWPPNTTVSITCSFWPITLHLIITDLIYTLNGDKSVNYMTIWQQIKQDQQGEAVTFLFWVEMTTAAFIQAMFGAAYSCLAAFMLLNLAHDLFREVIIVAFCIYLYFYTKESFWDTWWCKFILYCHLWMSP